MTQTSRDISSLSATDRLARFLEWPTVRRGPYGWGRVLAGFALLVLGCGLVAVVAGTLLGIGASVEGEPTQPTSPARGVLQAGLPIALWGLVVVAVARMVFRMRVDDLFSHLPGIRWGLLVRAALVALVCLGILFTIMSVVKGRSAQLTTPALLGVLAAVIVIPLQSMAEELIFRGFSMQMVLGKLGTSTARYWVASLVFGILFASIHAASNLTVWLALMAFALLFSYLVWRLAGLEGSMGLHIGNNVALGIQGALVGTDLATRQSNATATVVEALAQLAVAALAAAIIVRLGRRDEVRRPREV